MRPDQKQESFVMKKIVLLIVLFTFAFPLYGKAQEPRNFKFSYAVTLKDLAPKAKKVQLWIPVPQNGQYQKIWDLKLKVQGMENWTGQISLKKEKLYGNKYFYIEFDPSQSQRKEYTFSLTFKASRKGISKLQDKTPATKEKELKKYLAPNKSVPIGNAKINKRIQEALPKKTDSPLKIARSIYDYLIKEMRYDKSGTGWGKGDAVWACDSARGNCTDFHSLFISMMRTLLVPARFEIGFPLPEGKKEGEIKGYHCWGWFYADHLGWVPVDISEADKHPEKKELFFGGLDNNRIGFTTGRDLVLEPSPSQGSLNFFVYPLVEVDGKSHKFQRKFIFKEIQPKGNK